MRLFKFSSLVLLVTGFAQLALAGNPPNFSAEYSVRRGNFEAGRATVTLRQDNNHYEYKSVSEPSGVVAVFASDKVTQTSKGAIQNNRFVPNSFTFLHMKGKKRKRYKTTQFNWSNNTVRYRYRGDDKTLQVPGNTLDEFTLQIAVMKDLKAGEKSLSYSVADDGKLKKFNFRVLGQERVSTPAGEFNAIKIQRIRKNKNKELYMWCAPRLGNMLIKMVQVKKGKVNTMLLTRYRTGR